MGKETPYISEMTESPRDDISFFRRFIISGLASIDHRLLQDKSPINFARVNTDNESGESYVSICKREPVVGITVTLDNQVEKFFQTWIDTGLGDYKISYKMLVVFGVALVVFLFMYCFASQLARKQYEKQLQEREQRVSV